MIIKYKWKREMYIMTPSTGNGRGKGNRCQQQPWSHHQSTRFPLWPDHHQDDDDDRKQSSTSRLSRNYLFSCVVVVGGERKRLIVNIDDLSRRVCNDPTGRIYRCGLRQLCAGESIHRMKNDDGSEKQERAPCVIATFSKHRSRLNIYIYKPRLISF